MTASRVACGETLAEPLQVDAGQVADRAGVRSLALVHLPPEASGFEDEIRREASAVFHGEVLIPNDGDMIELPTRG